MNSLVHYDNISKIFRFLQNPKENYISSILSQLVFDRLKPLRRIHHSLMEKKNLIDALTILYKFPLDSNAVNVMAIRLQ